MSYAWSWRHAILQSDLPATTRHVLLTLGCHMTEAGDSCFPSQVTLSRETGLGVNTVNKHIQAAQRLGWITVEKLGMRGQKWRLNSYRAALPEGVSLGDKPSASKGVAVNGSRSKETPPKGVSPNARIAVSADASRDQAVSPKEGEVLQEVESNIPQNIPDSTPDSNSDSPLIETHGLKISRVFIEAVKARWNAMAAGSQVDPLQIMTPQRARWIDARLTDCGGDKDLLMRAIDRVPWDAHRDGQTQARNGRGRWRADFDWVFSQAQRFTQCLETKCDYRAPPNPADLSFSSSQHSQHHDPHRYTDRPYNPSERANSRSAAYDRAAQLALEALQRGGT